MIKNNYIFGISITLTLESIRVYSPNNVPK